MKANTEIMFGLEHQETLDASVEDVVDHITDYAPRNDKEALDAVTWPIRVYVYRRVDVTRYANLMAERTLEDALEWLDEENGDPENSTEPTEEMKKAAADFANVIVKEYVPWACEPTGQVIEVTREMVERDEIPDGKP